MPLQASAEPILTVGLSTRRAGGSWAGHCDDALAAYAAHTATPAFRAAALRVRRAAAARRAPPAHALGTRAVR
jgi:hypothetical protein